MPAAYPKPWFPMLPVIGRCGAARDPSVPLSRFLSEDALPTATGGAAIFWALHSAGVGAGDRVALPAFHCPTMVFPVLALGAEPVFVPIEADLSVRLAAIRARCGAHAPRAVLLPHFFGFRQPELESIRDWCEARRAVLIEDCAHAFYGADEGFVPGRVGHYAIASTRKFFAGTEGGALVANGAPLRVNLQRAPVRAELRALVDTWQLAVRAGSLPFSGPRLGPDGQLDGPTDAAAALAEAQPRPVHPDELAIAAQARRALFVGRALIRRTDHARSAAVRRVRYRRWAAVVAQTPGVRAFREAPPETGVPYAYPALLEAPQAQFTRLKHAGVQVWRWDSLARSDCAVSRHLGLALVQLPCQQSVGDAGFEALLAAFQQAIAAA